MLKIAAGDKRIYARSGAALIGAFDGPATAENIAALAGRFRMPVDFVEKSLASRPRRAAAPSRMSHRAAPEAPAVHRPPQQAAAPAPVPATRPAPSKPATVVRPRNDVRANIRSEDVAASWRAQFGRVVED